MLFNEEAFRTFLCDHNITASYCLSWDVSQVFQAIDTWKVAEQVRISDMAVFSNAVLFLEIIHFYTSFYEFNKCLRIRERESLSCSSLLVPALLWKNTQTSAAQVT